LIWLVVGTVLPAAIIAWATGWVLRRVAPRFDFVDRPTARKQHGREIALGGGLAIWLAVVLPLTLGSLLAVSIVRAPESSSVWTGVLPGGLAELVQTHAEGVVNEQPRLWLILAGATFIMLLGLIDDRRGLDWRVRLSAQAITAGVLVYNGFRLSLFIEVPSITAVVSVLWIVGLINSFNMLDNLDGLSGGVAMIAAGMLATVLLMAPDPVTNRPQLFIAGLMLLVAGGAFGFLLHNWPPARMFMGDAGAYLLGFLLAIATIMATFAGGDVPSHAIFAPLCILAVPIYDTLSVLIIRFREGRNPFAADRSHFSHRLLGLGMSGLQVMLTIYLATATTGLGALLLHQVDAFGATVILLLVSCVLLLVAILEMAGNRQRPG